MRRPPAFQVYASDDLASPDYYLLTLAERGLLDAMRRACWVDRDGAIPRDPDQLAIVLRCPALEVHTALSGRVLRLFQPGADASCLVEPDLQRQMGELMERRLKQSKAAEDTNKAKREKKALSATVSEPVSATDSDTLLRREEQRRNPSVGPASLPDGSASWVRDYEQHEGSEAPRRVGGNL